MLGTLVLVIGFAAPAMPSFGRNKVRITCSLALVVAIGWGAAYFLWLFIVLRRRVRLLDVSNG